MAFSTSLDALNNIFAVLTKIEQNTSSSNQQASGDSKKTVSGNIEGSFSKFGNIKDTASSIKDLAESVSLLTKSMTKFYLAPGKKSIINFLTNLSGVLGNGHIVSEESTIKDGVITSKNYKSISLEKAEAIGIISNSLGKLALGILPLGLMTASGMTWLASKGMGMIFDQLEKLNKNYGKIKKGAEALGEIGKAMIFWSLGLIGMAASIVLAGKILSSGGNPWVGFLALIATIGLMGTTVLLLGKFGGDMRKGADTMAIMGLGMFAWAVGLVSIAWALNTAGSILSKGQPWYYGAALLVGVITLMSGVIWMLGKAKGDIINGAITLGIMGLAMLTWSIGLVATAWAISKAGNILSNGKSENILMGIGLLIGVVALMTGAMLLLGALKGNIIMGGITLMLMGVSLMIFSLSLTMFAKASNATFGSIKGKDKDNSAPWIALGFIVAYGATLAGIGIPLVAGLIALGSASVILMGISLYMLSKGLINVATSYKTIKQQLGNKSITSVISELVGGTLRGILDGYEMGIKGSSERGIFKKIKVAHNAAETLSLLGEALKAFAVAGSISPIEGYDSKGKPIFGKPVNVDVIFKNIVSTFSSFITTLVESTKDLTGEKARAIKKLGRALTGRRGILSACIDFSEVLQAFSKVGKNGEMAVPSFNTDGSPKLDSKGKPIMTSVSTTKVAANIADTMGIFITSLTEHLDGISNRDLRKIKKAGKTLNAGLFDSINSFSKTLLMYAQEKKGYIRLLDKDGKPTGKYVPTKYVIDSISLNIEMFINGINELNNKIKGKGGINTSVLYNLDMFNKRIKDLTSQKDGIEKTASALTKMITPLKDFSTVLKEMDTDKLVSLAAISANEIKAAIEKTKEPFGENLMDRVWTKLKGVSGARSEEQEKPIVIQKQEQRAYSKIEQEKQREEDWDMIANKIGQQVAQGLKNTKYQFVLDTVMANGGSGTLFIK